MEFPINFGAPVAGNVVELKLNNDFMAVLENMDPETEFQILFGKDGVTSALLTLFQKITVEVDGQFQEFPFEEIAQPTVNDCFYEEDKVLTFFGGVSRRIFLPQRLTQESKDTTRERTIKAEAEAKQRKTVMTEAPIKGFIEHHTCQSDSFRPTDLKRFQATRCRQGTGPKAAKARRNYGRTSHPAVALPDD